MLRGEWLYRDYKWIEETVMLLLEIFLCLWMLGVGYMSLACLHRGRSMGFMEFGFILRLL